MPISAMRNVRAHPLNVLLFLSSLLGFLGAVGLASLSIWVRNYSRWLLLASIAFLCIGSVQLYFRKSCRESSTASLVLFWIAVVIVILIAVFPQLIASLIAG